MDSGALVRKLLEHGANATILDAKGRTPLTIALEKEKCRRDNDPERSQIETPLEVILKLANPLHILDNDLMAATKLEYGDAKNTLISLLDIAKGITVSEELICHVLNRSHVDNRKIKLLMQRSGDIGVTAKMLEAVQSDHGLEELLRHKPVCRITPEILKSQQTPKCMKLLLDFDPKTSVTEAVIFRALNIGNHWSRGHGLFKKDGFDVLETLFDRSPDIAVTQEMLQSVCCAADMEILLKHLKPGTRISTDVVTAVSKTEMGEPDQRGLMKLGEACRTMCLLLKFDPSIKLDPKIALRTIEYSDSAEKLEMLLKHDSSMPRNGAS